MSHPLAHFPNVILEDGIYKVRRMLKGRRKKVSTGFGVGQERKAERRVHEIQNALNDESAGWAKRRVPTFDDWWDTYRVTYSQRKRPSSQANDLKAVTWALPDLTRRGLDDITVSRAMKVLTRMRKSLAESTVRTYWAILAAIFERAVAEGHLTTNHWRKLEVGRMAVRQRTLSHTEEARLRGVLEPFHDRWLTFMLGTGCRIGEALNVAPRDLDFVHKNIHLRVTKGSRPRHIPLFPAVEAVLKAQLEATPRALWGQRTAKSYNHILWRRARALGLPALSNHTLRHTFGTRWLQEGKDIYLLSKILGHASVTMTERVYAHLVKEDVVALALAAGAPKQAGRIVQWKSGP